MTKTVATGKRQYRMGVRAQRSEETARRIREAALEKFSGRSYDEVTLAEIAEAAGVTVPTLIAHFGRKDDLFVAACQFVANAVMDARDEAPVGDHAGAIRNLLESYETSGEGTLHLLAQEDRFPAVRTITEAGRRYHRSWVKRVFATSLEPLRGARKEQLFVQLMVATDILAWKLMRLDMKLSRRRTEAAMVGAVEALIGSG
jgi:AcrR family transcriptional regulator